MIIKVCGMREPENIRTLCQLPVDYVGFIFYPQSSRYVIDTEVTGHVSGNAKRTGVFVNETFETVLSVAHAAKLDCVQLHGDESSGLCQQLRQAGFTVIKAFSVEDKEDIVKTELYEGAADIFLFDTKTTGYGGSGKQFDWPVLAHYTGNTPFLLSGGIKPESIKALQKFSHPQFTGVDLNSGFEDAPALKNIQKLQQFIEKIKTI